MLGKLWFTTVFCSSLLIRMGSSLDFGDLMHDVEAKEAGKVSFLRRLVKQIRLNSEKFPNFHF